MTSSPRSEHQFVGTEPSAPYGAGVTVRFLKSDFHRQWMPFMDIHAKWFFLASVGIVLNLYLILLAGRFFSSGWIVLAIAALCAIYYFSDRFDVLDMIPAVLLYYVPLWLMVSGLALYDLVVNFPRLRLPCNRVVLTVTSINLSVALLAGMVLLTR